MAWDEWEQLKAEAAERHSAHTELNQLDGGGGGGGGPALPGKTGDLAVGHADLVTIGKHAHGLYDKLWDRARTAVPSSDKAAGNLSHQGFALGAGLRHVADRWDEQLASLRDACAHISNHLQVTRKIHAGDEHYIQRQASSIDALDAGFDERVGGPGKKNRHDN
ncbi:hypothetical protein [Streptomyces odontomachi]|uniref:hypothetical protein n=1 Tax=Streptomyces odontomachi TaxID=2944940 RepID=UPI00210AB355|nr:hypothetical protein [Streptomyces sp. ODS25]